MTRLAQHQPRPSGDHILLTRKAAAHFLDRSPDYIRQVATPIACDVQSRAVLYDYDQLAERFVRRVA